MNNALSTIRNILSNMVTAVKGKATSFVNAGKDLIRGLIRGIKNMTSNAIGAITGVVDGVVNKAKSILRIKSPSRVFEDIGDDTMAGFVQGIDAMAGSAVRSVSSMAQDVTGAFNPDLSIGKHDYSNHVKGMQGQLSQTLTSQVSSKLSVNRQPAQINMTLGGRSYKAFVEDITNGQTQQVNLVEKYGGG